MRGLLYTCRSSPNCGKSDISVPESEYYTKGLELVALLKSLCGCKLINDIEKMPLRIRPVGVFTENVN